MPEFDEELIKKYTPPIYNFTVRLVGEFYAPDVTQDIFFKVWKNWKKFNREKAGLKTWIFTIARNTITDFLRKKKEISFSKLDNEANDFSFSENIEDQVILPDEALQKLQDKELLNSLLSQLREEYQTVLILYYQEEMTFAEIGKVLDKPLNTVKSHHHRALLKLKKMITH